MAEPFTAVRYDRHRRVPGPPELTVILQTHLRDHVAHGPGARLFTGVRGGHLPSITYRRAWRQARRAVFTDQQYGSPLARRPYDLRHACVSTWHSGGVPPTQVAKWAGHTVDVLLRIYASCLEGQDEIAKKRIVRGAPAECGAGMAARAQPRVPCHRSVEKRALRIVTRELLNTFFNAL